MGASRVGVEDTLDKEGAEPLVTHEVSIRSRSVICCLRNKIRCSCSVAWISASLTRERAIFRSAETLVIAWLEIWLASSLTLLMTLSTGSAGQART